MCLSFGLMGAKACKLSRALSFQGIKRVSSGPTLLTPKGYIPVAVGINDQETKRFMVQTRALCNAEFMEFLCRSAEEYGFCNNGILRIPYDPKAFEERVMQSAKEMIFMVQPAAS